jgi:hypothetical protein
MRGGGDGGANDCTNSVAAKLLGAVVALEGRQMVAGSGITKIAGVARI